jgi:putative hydrolase of the HAD superfamily
MSRTKETWRVFAFDFDGVLVDSYFCLPSVYSDIAGHLGLENSTEEFVERALKYEDEQDMVENYDRKSWWPMLCKEFQVNVDEEKLGELVQIYWMKRSEQSKIITGTIEALERLQDRGATLIILAASDGQLNMKRTRVEKSGLSGFFNDILIITDDVVNVEDAIGSVMKKYGVLMNEIAFINDKPAPINRISQSFKDITTIKVEFEGILKLAWNEEECAPTYRIRRLSELERIIG